MKETPYALAYRIEAIILAELGPESYRVETFKPKSNDEGLKLHLGLLQEKRDWVQITKSAYQERVAKYFNRKVKPRSFQVGDLVLFKVTLATKDTTKRKLAPNWKGPYKVISC